jgi:hypothetical protein
MHVMSERVVHLVEVIANDVTDTSNPTKPSTPLRFTATVNPNNIIIHGAARPEDLLPQSLPVGVRARRFIELEVEHDSDEDGPILRPRKYTATINEHNIIVHGAARSDNEAISSKSPVDHAALSPKLHEAPQGNRCTKASHTSDDKDNDSDSSAVSTDIELNTGERRNTRGIAERIKTTDIYINRRQKSAIARPGPDAEGKFIIEKLLEQIENSEDENDPKILVKWQGYGLDETTWELRSSLLEDAPAEVRKLDAGKSIVQDQGNKSPVKSQSWPTGLSEKAFHGFDVTLHGDNNIAASSSGPLHKTQAEPQNTESDDDDAPIPRRGTNAAPSSQIRSPLQPIPIMLQRMRDQSPDSIFDGPTPTPSFWEASPEPPSSVPKPMIAPMPNGQSPDLFFTPGPGSMPTSRRNTGTSVERVARARLGEGYSVPAGTRTNRVTSRAISDGLGHARSSSTGEASSTTANSIVHSPYTLLKPDHRPLPSESNKRKMRRFTEQFITKRPRFHGLQ